MIYLNQVLRAFTDASEYVPGARLFFFFALKYIKRLTKNPTTATIGTSQKNAWVK